MGTQISLFAQPNNISRRPFRAPIKKEPRFANYYVAQFLRALANPSCGKWAHDGCFCGSAREPREYHCWKAGWGYTSIRMKAGFNSWKKAAWRALKELFTFLCVKSEPSSSFSSSLGSALRRGRCCE